MNPFTSNPSVRRRRATLGMFALAILINTLALPSARAHPITIWNGIDGPGSLTITTDDYGSFGVALGWLDTVDLGLDPISGDPLVGPLTHVAHLFAFIDPTPIGNGTHRGVLSTHPLLLNFYDDGNLTGAVTAPNALIDPATCASQFTVTGPGVDLHFSLTQRVSEVQGGPNGEVRVALEQTYIMTNVSTDPVELIIVKNLDQDLFLDDDCGTFGCDDLLGADFAELDRPQVYTLAANFSVEALVLRTRDNHDPDLPDDVPSSVDFVYYCGKQTMAASESPDYPGGACPPYEYGTDFQIWDNFGVPNCWKNNVPGVGHDVPGISPQLQGDSFMGLQVEASLEPGVPYEFSFHTLYGFRPPPVTQAPPLFTAEPTQYDPATGCSQFLWTITNDNPNVPGEPFVDIETFYVDIETGTGGDGPCVQMTPPDGWTAELCASDTNGHSLYRFTGGDPIDGGDSVSGSVTINPNGPDPATDPVTGIEIPPLSIVLHAAQQQPPAQCDFNFGPTADGEWSDPIVATAFLANLVTLWNQVTGDGSLTVTVDDFGSHADTFAGGQAWLDFFDPSADPIQGELPEEFVVFADHVFFFIDPSEIGNGTHRGVATTHQGLLATYDDGNIHCVITQPNSTDNLPTSTDSTFSCTGPGVAFDVELIQTVSALPTGPDGATAALEQNYAVTNVGDNPLELILTKHIDMDMPWGGGTFHLDDLVGADFAEFVRPQVFARDDGLVTSYLTLRTAVDMWLDPGTLDSVFYAGKQGITPPPNPYYPPSGCPTYDYGTDFQVWDNFGAPNCWKNHVPGVGHNVPGESPSLDGDAFIGMQVEFRLSVDDPHDVTFVQQYGRGPRDAPPQIMHERGWAGQTRPHSAYVDPRTDVAFPPLPPDPRGLTEAFIRFSDNVVDFNGGDVNAGNLSMSETGGSPAPSIIAVDDANPPHGVYFRVQWDRQITLQEWSGLVANVINFNGLPILFGGDQGPGVNESDRVDFAALPADIDQNGTVNPLDLLTFKQFVNGIAAPVLGTFEDRLDINRDNTVNPLDLLAFKQLINGIPPATQPWAGESLNNPQP